VETAFLATLYVLFFREVGTRRIHITSATGLPDWIERTDILGGLIHEYHARRERIRGFCILQARRKMTRSTM
jgi:hypothetical protein